MKVLLTAGVRSGDLCHGCSSCRHVFRHAWKSESDWALPFPITITYSVGIRFTVIDGPRPSGLTSYVPSHPYRTPYAEHDTGDPRQTPLLFLITRLNLFADHNLACDYEPARRGGEEGGRGGGGGSRGDENQAAAA